MSEKRHSMSQVATTRPFALARRLRRMKILACVQMASGGGGLAAGLVLVITGHPAIGALPLIAGGVVLYRGERRLSRVDAIARKQLYGAAAGVYGAHGGCGGGGFLGCAAGCSGGD